jgi:hypothetical protein
VCVSAGGGGTPPLQEAATSSQVRWQKERKRQMRKHQMKEPGAPAGLFLFDGSGLRQNL